MKGSSSIAASAVLLVVVLVEGFNALPASVKCPNPDPRDHAVFFPHETNCNQFYRCDHGTALLENCPRDLHWNADLDICVSPSVAGCKATAGDGGDEGDDGGSEGDGGDDGGSEGDGGDDGGSEGDDSSSSSSSSSSEEGSSSSSSSSEEGGDIKCPSSQNGISVYVPNPEDCTKFYQCSNGVPVLQVCPPGLNFNPTLNVCDFPSRAGCTVSN